MTRDAQPPLRLVREVDSRAKQIKQRPLILFAAYDLAACSAGAAYLRQAGFRVEETNSGGEVVPLFLSRQPDLVLMDARLPEIDGIEVCAALRGQPQGREVPIFLIDGWTKAELARQAIEAGATDLVRTPVNWVVLSHRIRHTVRVLRAFDEWRKDRWSLHEAEQTAIHASEEALLLKNYDGLTGLPNRTMFTDFLGLALARSERLGVQDAVLFLDIDGFKTVNDTLGREVGDQVLKEVASRLRRCLRGEDQLGRSTDPANSAMARLTGDEFVVLLHQVDDEKTAGRVADRLLQAMSKAYQVQGQSQEIFLSASIGIAFSQEREHEDSLMQRAETAMDHAKKRGRNHFEFYREFMGSPSVNKLQIKTGLHRALEKDEFFLEYQPLISSRSGRISGVEALLRWRHPDSGRLPPSHFIPVAEETGLMVPIGEWVLREACRQAQAWLDSGLPAIRMSLNVARCQLDENDFAGIVCRALLESGLNPSLLELELSERGVLKDDPHTLRQLGEIKALGARLAIDDFGTGQTSLAYLRKFPLDVLKIDRSFVEGLDSDADAAAIASAIIAMSHRLNLSVVGEGVETEAQAAFLREYRCNELQGYLFHRPLAAAEVERLLSGHGPASAFHSA